MGFRYVLHCKKCHYGTCLWVGIGFLYAKTYHDAMEEVKTGKLGKEIKDFLLKYSNGAIDPELRIFQCEKCGDYASLRTLAMYIPDGINTRQNEKYVFPGEFNKYYKLYKEYRHTCKKCGGIMKLIRQNNAVEHLECPHCKGEILSISDVMSWS